MAVVLNSETYFQLSKGDFQYMGQIEVMLIESIPTWYVIFLSKSCNGSLHSCQMCRYCKH